MLGLIMTAVVITAAAAFGYTLFKLLEWFIRDVLMHPIRTLKAILSLPLLPFKAIAYIGSSIYHKMVRSTTKPLLSRELPRAPEGLSPIKDQKASETEDLVKALKDRVQLLMTEVHEVPTAYASRISAAYCSAKRLPGIRFVREDGGSVFGGDLNAIREDQGTYEDPVYVAAYELASLYLRGADLESICRTASSAPDIKVGWHQKVTLT